MSRNVTDPVVNKVAGDHKHATRGSCERTGGAAPSRIGELDDFGHRREVSPVRVCAESASSS